MLDWYANWTGLTVVNQDEVQVGLVTESDIVPLIQPPICAACQECQDLLKIWKFGWAASLIFQFNDTMASTEMIPETTAR